jgi:DNA-binding protein HU-beta
MNQSELIEKVAQVTELNQAAAGQAVKAVVNAILDGLLAGDAVRVSGLGVFNVAARPARQGRNPRTGESIQIAATKAVRFHAGKAIKDALNPPTANAAPQKIKEIRGAEVNVLSTCGSVGTASSVLATTLSRLPPFDRYGISLRPQGTDSFTRGTDGSNPIPFSGESDANLIFGDSSHTETRLFRSRPTAC